MKLYTEKQITEIKNQALNKIYLALQEIDNTSESEAVNRHDVLLHIALKHLNNPPTENVYGWIKKGSLKGTFLK